MIKFNSVLKLPSGNTLELKLGKNEEFIIKTLVPYEFNRIIYSDEDLFDGSVEFYYKSGQPSVRTNKNTKRYILNYFISSLAKDYGLLIDTINADYLYTEAKKDNIVRIDKFISDYIRLDDIRLYYSTFRINQIMKYYVNLATCIKVKDNLLVGFRDLSIDFKRRYMILVIDDNSIYISEDHKDNDYMIDRVIKFIKNKILELNRETI